MPLPIPDRQNNYFSPFLTLALAVGNDEPCAYRRAYCISSFTFGSTASAQIS